MASTSAGRGEPGVGLLHDVLGLGPAADDALADVEQVARCSCQARPTVRGDRWKREGRGYGGPGRLRGMRSGSSVERPDVTLTALSRRGA